MTTEREVLAACLAYLGARPDCRVWRNQTGQLPDRNGRVVSFGLRGSADILGIGPGGRLVAVECKAPEGRVRPEQAAFGRMIHERGGIYILARSVEDLYSEFPPL